MDLPRKILLQSYLLEEGPGLFVRLHNTPRACQSPAPVPHVKKIRHSKCRSDPEANQRKTVLITSRKKVLPSFLGSFA